MKVASESPHGQEEIRRKQDHKYHRSQANLSVYERLTRKRNAKCCSAIRKEIHDDNGIKLHRKNLHGNHPEVLGFRIHLFILISICFIGFKGGHPLEILKESTSKLRIPVPIL